MGSLIAGREVPRRVRGAAEGGADRGHGRGGRDHPLHRRDAHAGRRRQGRRRDGRLQHAEAGAGAGRAALRRRDHARRVPQAHREGRRTGAALPAGLRQRADGRGHHLDPARHQGEVRAAPRGADHRQRAGRGGDAVAPLHHRPLPAGQGDRPDGRGGDAGCGWRSNSKPEELDALDREILQKQIEARGAEEGDRPGVAGPAGELLEGARRRSRSSRPR